ncbi:DUF4365 domain-containing protein [Aneurinibacillus sp. REN35]|uniref:DUF4365 domain-containing protein n=1 Tax=Aneurinibacillus sp. REN35 TaxID=3237286 RepID=UPI003527F120
MRQKQIASERACVTKVNSVVGNSFKGEFIEFPHRIDNGFDGAIVWQENGNIIDVIYVQCKGGDSYLPKNTSEKFRIQNMTKESVKAHKKVWDSVVGPAILVVTNSNNKAWWIDLKSKESFDESGEILYCNPNNIFNGSAKNKIKNLISKSIDKYSIPRLLVKNDILPNLLSNVPLKKISQDLYDHFKEKKMQSKCPDLHMNIEFTRVGWRHITRKKRNKGRIIQSLILLPLVPDIIENATEYETIDAKYYKDKKLKNKVIIDKLIIKAQCSFNYRFPSIIKIVLLRKRVITPSEIQQRIWFYSIYEARRKGNLEDLLR